jgi:hypothetical protein
VQPIQDVNSVINITPIYYQYLESSFNARNHYIEKINIKSTYQDNSSYPGYYAIFSFPQGTINELNILLIQVRMLIPDLVSHPSYRKPE